MKGKRTIYLDNAATTPVRKEVLEAMKPYWCESFGNPGSITKMGIIAKQAVKKARTDIATLLSRRPQEVVFTSGGTESNNLAIFGVVKSLEAEGVKVSDMHFITTNIEHSSITECFLELAKKGAKVDYLKVGENGIIETRDLRKTLKSNTVLVSIGYANNEIGVIQPIKEIAKEIRHARKCNQGGTSALSRGSTLVSIPLFHTDASQAGLYLNLNVNELGVDLMTLDAQKIYGPKGICLLFIKFGIKISPIIFGGGQEMGLRSGTENVPLIVGMAKALEICRQGSAFGMSKSLALANKKMIILRNYFWHKIQKEIPTAALNGDLENRLPNNLNISIPGIDSEFTVLCLDEKRIICSTKSACRRDEAGSAIVRSLGKSEDLVKSTLRFSLGEDIMQKDIDFVVNNLKIIIQKQLKQTIN